MFWLSQLSHTLQHEAKRLRKEIEEANARADQAEEREQFYRKQLVTESRIGLMFISPIPER